ncbi:MAG: hypothetical protein AAGF47_08540 [Planctomycetota bacterium]
MEHEHIKSWFRKHRNQDVIATIVIERIGSISVLMSKMNSRSHSISILHDHKVEQAAMGASVIDRIERLRLVFEHSLVVCGDKINIVWRPLGDRWHGELAVPITIISDTDNVLKFVVSICGLLEGSSVYLSTDNSMSEDVSRPLDDDADILKIV